MKIFTLLFLLTAFLSCSPWQTVNKQRHQFAGKLSKVVWLQVAGLTSEHLALIKYSLKNSREKTGFEDALCVGSLWSYNLYSIRPSAEQAFWTQMTGSGDMKGECRDYSRKPFWAQERVQQITSATLYQGRIDPKGVSLLTCKNELQEYLQLGPIFLMSKTPTEQKNLSLFHHQTALDLSSNKIYYDRTCQYGTCDASLYDNSRQIFLQLKKRSKYLTFVIRDTTFSESLSDKKIMRGREVLADINKVVTFFKKEAEADPELLFIISSAESKPIEFPLQGSNWLDFEKTGEGISYKNSSLQSSLWAFGARAENFCGMYEEQEVFSRILYNPRKQNILEYF